MSRAPRRRSRSQQRIEFIHPVDKQDWRIEDWTSFKNTFEIEQRQLAEFVKVALIQETPWLMARMRFGILPVVPPINSDPDFLKAFTTAEVAQNFQTDEEQVVIQMEILQDAWHKYLKEGPDEEQPIQPEPAPAPTSAPEAPAISSQTSPPPPPPIVPVKIRETEASADYEDPPQELLDVIHRFGFTLSIFNLPGRTPAARMQEIHWFASRLLEMQKMFEEPMAKNLARMAVMNEIQLRRADDEISARNVTSSAYWDVQQSKLRIEEIYQKQWSKLEEICPYIKNASNKIQVTGLVSEWIKAHQAYTVSGDNELIDGLFTNFEIQVLTRSSQQQGPQYRPGWVMAVKEARDNLHNPHYRRRIPTKNYKMIDDAFRDAYQRMIDAGEIVPIDLEDKGPQGEYPPLIQPDPTEELIPDVQVPLE